MPAAKAPKRQIETQEAQSERFIEMARELGADDSEERFNAKLKKVAGAKMADNSKLDKILADRGIPQGRWSHTEANLLDDGEWYANIFIEGRAEPARIDLGGAVGMINDLESAGEPRFAEMLTEAVRLCRAGRQ